MRIAAPATYNRSRGTETPPNSTDSSGKIAGTDRGTEPNRSAIIAKRVLMTPTDATTFASGGAERRGRKMRTCTTSPSNADSASVTTNATPKLATPTSNR